jgi:glycosyltransferase involved in cell wall biosynthesis
MRVAHVHRIRGIGGSERHLLTLLPALAELGVEPLLVGLDDDRGGDPAPFYEQLGSVETLRLPSRRDLDPLLPPRLARELGRRGVDLVHTHLVHGDVYGGAAAALARLPLVSTKHNDDPFRAGPFRFVERALTARALRVICITESLRRFNVERVGLPARKLEVIHYGLDAPPQPWGPNPPDEVPADARVLLAVARLVPQKGVDVAVRALPLVRERRPEAVLVVLGDGPERERLRADGVHLLGRVPDVGAWLRRAEVLVHPARWEGFGLALLEAMLAERPVVATRVSSIPEIVDDGTTGYLVEPDDPRALADAIVRVLDEPDELGAHGLARARAEFSVEKMARATLAVYDASAAR